MPSSIAQDRIVLIACFLALIFVTALISHENRQNKGRSALQENCRTAPAHASTMDKAQICSKKT